MKLSRGPIQLVHLLRFSASVPAVTLDICTSLHFISCFIHYSVKSICYPFSTFYNCGLSLNKTDMSFPDKILKIFNYRLLIHGYTCSSRTGMWKISNFKCLVNIPKVLSFIMYCHYLHGFIEIFKNYLKCF